MANEYYIHYFDKGFLSRIDEGTYEPHHGVTIQGVGAQEIAATGGSVGVYDVTGYGGILVQAKIGKHYSMTKSTSKNFEPFDGYVWQGLFPRENYHIYVTTYAWDGISKGTLLDDGAYFFASTGGEHQIGEVRVPANHYILHSTAGSTMVAHELEVQITTPEGTILFPDIRPLIVQKSQNYISSWNNAVWTIRIENTMGNQIYYEMTSGDEITRRDIPADVSQIRCYAYANAQVTRVWDDGFHEYLGMSPQTAASSLTIVDVLKTYDASKDGEFTWFCNIDAISANVGGDIRFGLLAMFGGQPYNKEVSLYHLATNEGIKNLTCTSSLMIPASGGDITTVSMGYDVNGTHKSKDVTITQVHGDDLGYTEKAETQLGSRTVTISETVNGRTYMDSITLSFKQQANVVSVSWIGESVSLAYGNIMAAGAGSNSIGKTSLTYTQTKKTTSTARTSGKTDTYTSGATSITFYRASGSASVNSSTGAVSMSGYAISDSRTREVAKVYASMVLNGRTITSGNVSVYQYNAYYDYKSFSVTSFVVGLVPDGGGSASVTSLNWSQQTYEIKSYSGSVITSGNSSGSPAKSYSVVSGSISVNSSTGEVIKKTPNTSPELANIGTIRVTLTWNGKTASKDLVVYQMAHINKLTASWTGTLSGDVYNSLSITITSSDSMSGNVTMEVGRTSVTNSMSGTSVTFKFTRAQLSDFDGYVSFSGAISGEFYVSGESGSVSIN